MIALLPKALALLRSSHTWWAALAAGLALTNCATSHQRDTARQQRAEVVAAFETHKAQAERLSREAETKNRQTEQELRHAQDKHAREVAAMQADLARSRAAAGAAAGQLRDATTAATARARAQCAAPAPAQLGTPADDPIGVLAYVLGRADQRAGELADIAEQRGLAGRACEREYAEAVRLTAAPVIFP